MNNLPQKQDENQHNQKSPVSPFLLFEAAIEFGIMLGLPLYAFIIAGKWLDKKWGTNFMVLLGIFLALLVSSYLIYKKINQYRKLLK